jgi:hypothetical protein
MTKVMALKPTAQRSKLSFMGEVIRAFLIVNGLAWLGVVLVSPYQRTMGAAASTRVDPRTGKPLVMKLKGCRPVGGGAEKAKADRRSAVPTTGPW